MLLRFWGVRGSIPVSGAKYAKYGGDTACVELSTPENPTVVIDAGSAIRRLGIRMMREERFTCTMFFTHVHLDHILGFPFFRPLYDKRAKLLIHDCPTAQGDMHTLISRMMGPPFFPVPYGEVQAKVEHRRTCITDNRMVLGDLEVCSIPLSHPNLGLGFKFTHNGRSFVFLTDNELGFPHRGGRSFEDYAEFCRGADLLVHDSEFTEKEYLATRGWGHSTYTEALRLAREAGVKAFGLYHHNQDRSDDQLDAMVKDCRERVAADGGPDVFAVHQDMEIDLG